MKQGLVINQKNRTQQKSLPTIIRSVLLAFQEQSSEVFDFLLATPNIDTTVRDQCEMTIRDNIKERIKKYPNLKDLGKTMLSKLDQVEDKQILSNKFSPKTITGKLFLRWREDSARRRDPNKN